MMSSKDSLKMKQSSSPPSPPSPSQTNNTTKTTLLLAITTSLFLRTLIALHPHSGQNNHHGSTTAYGGDYEAQRHWMELTYHLPLHLWYKHDVHYWGLDYPPLTAYGSLILGYGSAYLVGEESVALVESRGYEGIGHKVYMRATVIILDCLVYIPVVYAVVNRFVESRSRGNGSGRENGRENGRAFWLLGVLIQPALVIIDHGHFQYNAVCLGLALGSFHFMTKLNNNHNNNNNNNTTSINYSIGWNCIFGSILFCLALNWKQMALYYAPAVFSYLLGRCCCSSSFSSLYSLKPKTISKKWNITTILVQIVMLGLAVVATFSILWLPFYYYRHNVHETIVDVFAVIVRRIFPFSRGLFEGKVGNLWCVASVKPISIRERIPASIQPLCALALTLCMVLPFCILLFRVGRRATTNADSSTKNSASTSKSNNSTSKSNNNNSNNNNDLLQLKALLWGAAGSSLSFFLASFQVHEKSILLPLAPLSLLMMDQPSSATAIHWFSIVSMWSMWHLIVVDRLRVAYVSLIIIYLCYIYIYIAVGRGGKTVSTSTLTSTSTPTSAATSSISATTTFYFWDARLKHVLTRFVIPISSFVMISLHILEICITPPPNLPDLFPVLWVIESCLSFCVMWLISLWELTKLCSMTNPLSYEQEEYQQKKEK